MLGQVTELLGVHRTTGNGTMEAAVLVSQSALVLSSLKGTVLAPEPPHEIFLTHAAVNEVTHQEAFAGTKMMRLLETKTAKYKIIFIKYPPQGFCYRNREWTRTHIKIV